MITILETGTPLIRALESSRKRRRVRMSTFCLVLAVALLAGLSGRAQTPPSVRESYTKTDVRIPMRDGVNLYTVVFAPKDSSRDYPILLLRTPYSVPYGPDAFPDSLGPSARFSASGYIVVYQDVRGAYMSEGEYVNVRPQLGRHHGKRDIDESTDSYDTIDWLVRNVSHNNGRVGMWGISYPGFYAATGALSAHPALKAVSPQAPIADWFLGDDDHHNGAFYLMDNFAWDFNSRFDWPRPAATRNLAETGLTYPSNDAYRFYLDLGPLSNANARYFHGAVPFWNELMEHGTYDAYWKARNLLPHIRAVRPAMLTVAGWFDAEDFFGPIHIFEAIERQSPSTENRLVIGPWPHGGWSGGRGDSFGDIPFGSATGQYYRDEIEFPFFEHYLKDAREVTAPNARVFATGSSRWLSFDSWPPRERKLRSLYFAGQGSLSVSPPVETDSQPADSFLSDPANPAPYIETASRQIGRDSRYMIADQRFMAGRKDVLTYETPPLAENLTVAGPIVADLYVSTTGTDADWIVKVVDVYPDNAGEAESASGKTPMAGYQMLVRADVMRGKFRNSFEKPIPFVPGKITRVRFSLPDLCHTFRSGHRMMVQVQSSWFPIVDRNPQTFCDIYRAEAKDFHAETHRVYRSGAYPSRIVMGTIAPPEAESERHDR